MSANESGTGGVAGFAAEIREVTVMEDRARVVRRGAACLAAGRTVLRLAGVSPIAGDKTLAGSVLSGPKAARISNLRIVRFRKSRMESRPGEAAEAEREFRSASAEADRLRALAGMLEEDIKSAGVALSRTVKEMSAGASYGGADASEWGRALDLLSDRESKVRFEKAGIDADAEAAEERAEDLEERLNRLVDPGTVMGADIEAEVLADSAGDCTLEISYAVPCACWRPAHTAKVDRDSGECTAKVDTDAFVWQFTGEDWRDAQLLFSTQRPSLGTRPPLLAEDVVVARDKAEKVAVEARDSEIRTAGFGAAAGRKRADDLPGIDDSGSVYAVRAAHRTTVSTDGRPHRIALAGFESPAKVEMVCMPEIAEAVVRRVMLTNLGPAPLLAGPIDLVASSGYAGRASTLFVAPGEKFEIGFGPDPELRVKRKVERVQLEKGALSKWIKTAVTITVNLSNIGSSAKSFKLTERIPVSEIEQVRIDFKEGECKPKSSPDANGLLEWEINLPPSGRAAVVCKYVIEKTKDVVGL